MLLINPESDNSGNSHLKPNATFHFLLKELRHGDFQFFWSKLPQIITKYLCRTRNTYGTLRGRNQVNFQRKNKP